MIIDEVEVIVEDLPDVTVEEAREYVAYARGQLGGRLRKLTISPSEEPGKVSLGWETVQKFERIRRITGYLVGTIDRWNNAKRQEEKDRVKHVGGRGL